jgi:hypothetical protein
MIITFHTQRFFKLQVGDFTLALDPLSTEKGKKVSKFGSDIALQTVYDPEGLETATYGDREPITMYGPGSYESQGLQIVGFGVSLPDSEPKNHTVYSFVFDDMRIGVLGALDTKGLLPPEALEALDDADIIFTPATEEGIEFASSFSPHALVLTGYEDLKDIKELTDTLSPEQFETLDKLTLKSRDLSDKQSFVYALSA